MWFPDGVWEHIRSYMPIWKHPYNKVMKELPKIQRDIFRIEYWRELPIRRKDIYLYAGIAKFGGIGWSNKMYMVKEIQDYPFFHPKPDGYRLPGGFSRVPNENDSMEFPKTIHTYYLAAGQDLVALGIKEET